MGAKSSVIHKISTQDAEVIDDFVLLIRTWDHSMIKLMTQQLVQLTFNFCLTPEQFLKMLRLPNGNHLEPIVDRWFTLLRKKPSSKVFSGLELLSALALTVLHGTPAERMESCFAIFDFEKTGQLSLDVFTMLLKTCIQGLSKITVGLKPYFDQINVHKTLMDFVTKSTKSILHDSPNGDPKLKLKINRDQFLKWAENTWEIQKIMSVLDQRPSNHISSGGTQIGSGDNSVAKPASLLPTPPSSKLTKQDRHSAMEIKRLTNARQLLESNLRRTEIELEVERKSRERADNALEIVETRQRSCEKTITTLKKEIQVLKNKLEHTSKNQSKDTTPISGSGMESSSNLMSVEVLAALLECSVEQALEKQKEGERKYDAILEQRRVVGENSAATRIQACFRGKLGRLALLCVRQKNEAALKIQNAHHRRKKRVLIRQNEAAVTLQKVQRGRQDRELVRKKKEEKQKLQRIESLSQENNAKRIQNTFKRSKAKKDAAKKEMAATKLQALQRGRMARIKSQEQRENRKEKSEVSETEIGNVSKDGIKRGSSRSLSSFVSRSSDTTAENAGSNEEESDAVIELIVAYRIEGNTNTLEYKVRWQGTDESEDEWFSRDDLVEEGGYLLNLVTNYEEVNYAELQEYLRTVSSVSSQISKRSSNGQEENDEEECDIESIVDHRIIDGKIVEYRVRWAGSGEEEDEWFDRKSLLEAGGDTPRLLMMYEKQEQETLKDFITKES